MLMIVLSAGASYDSNPFHTDTGWNPHARLPLANQQEILVNGRREILINVAEAFPRF